MELYILTLDYYTDDTGYVHEVLYTTTNMIMAYTRFKTTVKNCKEQDVGYTIMTDDKTQYFAHKEMPVYTRVKLSTLTLSIKSI